MKTNSSQSRYVPPPAGIYQLRIALRYIEPAIWRRVLVPDNWLLGDLHPLFVCVMGWNGYHMHAFRFGGGFRQEEYSTPQVVRECGTSVRNEDTVFLHHVLKRKGQVFTYEYDFGDCWLHQVKVEKILPFDPGVALPVCLAGERACPPEDCGGVPGYLKVMRAVGSKPAPDLDELRGWLGGYDPERFDLDALNRGLLKFREEAVISRKTLKRLK